MLFNFVRKLVIKNGNGPHRPEGNENGQGTRPEAGPSKAKPSAGTGFITVQKSLKTFEPTDQRGVSTCA